jgi:mannose-6-phosphate isomerase-like protein (cupin superfamily)
MRGAVEIHHVDDIAAERDHTVHTSGPVLRSELLSVSFSIWPASSRDDQRPHAEDEVYHVVAGRAVISVEGEDAPVRAGSLIYVPAGVEHHFHSIDEELAVVVFWAPPHG